MTPATRCDECGSRRTIADLRTAVPGSPAAATANLSRLCHRCLTLPRWQPETGAADAPRS